MHANELDRRLREWGAEYGGGKYDNLGFPASNILARVVEMGGFVPGSNGRLVSRERTPADEVERVVRKMEQGAMYELAQVVRCDYFRPGIAMTHRLELLRRIGLPMSERTYYGRLAEGKEVVCCELEEAKA
jgi:hypothetical protein